MLHRLVFLLKTSPTHSKNILNMIKLKKKKLKIFGLNDEATKPLEKEKAKTINCHHSDVLWNSKTPSLVKFSHKIFPLFNRFSTFDKNVNLSKANPEAENSFLVFPSLNTSIFYDVSKNSEHTKTFRGARPKSHPPKIQKFNFLEQKKVNAQNGRVFKLFPWWQWILLPKSHREKDNLIINPFKPFKDTISKTNTCFRQHHDLEPKHSKKSRQRRVEENFSKKKIS
jgi:hypothetical protein